MEESRKIQIRLIRWRYLSIKEDKIAEIHSTIILQTFRGICKYRKNNIIFLLLLLVTLEINYRRSAT